MIYMPRGLMGGGGVVSNVLGSETMIFVTRNVAKDGVIKAIDASHYTGNVEKMLDKIAPHNAMFPETSLDVLSFGRVRGDTFRIIARHPYPFLDIYI